METSFIGGVRRSTQREPPTMGKLYHLRLTTFSGVRATTYETCNIFSGMNIEPSSPSIDVGYLSNLPFSETKTC